MKDKEKQIEICENCKIKDNCSHRILIHMEKCKVNDCDYFQNVSTDKEMQIEEMAKIMRLHICKDKPCKECDCHGLGDKTSELYHCDCYYYAKSLVKQGYRKLPEDSVVLSREELKKLETNYKIGLGKSQSWCKSLKNRIEELEKENFKLEVENEVLKEENRLLKEQAEQLRQEIITLSQELVNSRKETAEKIFKGMLNEILSIEEKVNGRRQTIKLSSNEDGTIVTSMLCDIDEYVCDFAKGFIHKYAEKYEVEIKE